MNENPLQTIISTPTESEIDTLKSEVAEMREQLADLCRVGMLISARLDVAAQESLTDQYICATAHPELKHRLIKARALLARRAEGK